MKPWIPLVSVISAVWAVCLLGSYALECQRVSAERDRQKLVHLYRPLTTLFLTRHVTAYTAISSPRLLHRVENAWIELTSSRRRNAALKRAWRALFDVRSSTSAEIEFGGRFPLREIADLTGRSAEYADAKLLHHISRADRSRYEEVGNTLLTDAEFDLFEFINAKHERLSRRFD